MNWMLPAINQFDNMRFYDDHKKEEIEFSLTGREELRDE